MSAVKSWGGNTRATREVPRPRSWTQTPTWHWRSWLGYKMRISVGFTDGRPPYAYRSHEHHARVVLEAQAGGVPVSVYDPVGANDITPRRGPPPGGGRRPKI